MNSVRQLFVAFIVTSITCQDVKGYGSIAHEAKPNGLLTRFPNIKLIIREGFHKLFSCLTFDKYNMLEETSANIYHVTIMARNNISTIPIHLSPFRCSVPFLYSVRALCLVRILYSVCVYTRSALRARSPQSTFLPLYCSIQQQEEGCVKSRCRSS